MTPIMTLEVSTFQDELLAGSRPVLLITLVSCGGSWAYAERDGCVPSDLGLWSAGRARGGMLGHGQVRNRKDLYVMH